MAPGPRTAVPSATQCVGVKQPGQCVWMYYYGHTTRMQVTMPLPGQGTSLLNRNHNSEANVLAQHSESVRNSCIQGPHLPKPPPGSPHKADHTAWHALHLCAQTAWLLTRPHARQARQLTNTPPHVQQDNRRTSHAAHALGNRRLPVGAQTMKEAPSRHGPIPTQHMLFFDRYQASFVENPNLTFCRQPCPTEPGAAPNNISQP
jgi:hypothetical protein